jgi:hypothetical protein
MIMNEHCLRALERVGATLIDARSDLEEIDPQTRELDELHGAISRAHALCWQIIYQNKCGPTMMREMEKFGASA